VAAADVRGWIGRAVDDELGIHEGAIPIWFPV